MVEGDLNGPTVDYTCTAHYRTAPVHVEIEVLLGEGASRRRSQCVPDVNV